MAKKHVPITEVIRPVMQLRAGLDRLSSLVLREKMGFGVSQFRILYVLAFKPDITQKDIADFWDVTEASVSRQMGILKKRGYVLSKPKTTISPTGKKALDQAMKHLSASFEKIFAKITNNDRDMTAKLLEKLLEQVKICTTHEAQK